MAAHRQAIKENVLLLENVTMESVRLATFSIMQIKFALQTVMLIVKLTNVLLLEEVVVAMIGCVLMEKLMLITEEDLLIVHHVGVKYI